MTEREAREARLRQLLRRQWLIEQLGALVVAMDALPQPADPPTDPNERTPAARLAYHEAVERYCAAWDGLQAQFAARARELLADLASEPEPTVAQLRFIAAFDQWQQHTADAYAEDRALAAKIKSRMRERAAAARIASRQHEEGEQAEG